MLVHLDRNEYALLGVGQRDLYNAMIAIADHTLGLRDDHRHRTTKRARRSADDEVQAIYRWLRQGAKHIERGERVLSYRQLRRALAQFSIELEVTGSNRATLVRYEERTSGLLRRRTERVRVKIADTGYRDEGTDIPKSEMKRIREACGLTEANGVDSHAFYSTGVVLDAFICRYRRVLLRLAHT